MLLEWDLLACKELTVLKLNQLFIYYYFLLHCMACRILIASTGIEPGPLAGKVQSPNHWTVREFPESVILKLPTNKSLHLEKS